MLPTKQWKIAKIDSLGFRCCQQMLQVDRRYLKKAKIKFNNLYDDKQTNNILDIKQHLNDIGIESSLLEALLTIFLIK